MAVNNENGERIMSLILTRRPTESLMIGDDIRVQIMEVNGRQVRIAIEAPKDIVILRQELYAAIR